MFGYIKPFQPELKVRELELYKSVYCGLCKQIGHSYSQISRMILSYDMAFLSLVALAVDPKEPYFKRKSCFLHPLRKRACLASCDALKLSADCSVVLAYYKLRDNLKDDSGAKRAAGLPAWPVLARCKRRAAKRQPKIAEILKTMAQNQAQIESQASFSIDCACDPTARALAEISALLSPAPEFVPAFFRMGYMLGRFIYMLDAADDLEQDIKAGRFNPLIKKFGLSDPCAEQKREMLEYARQDLNVTCAQLAGAFELIPFQRYKPLLDNIVYLGMRAMQNQVFDRQIKNILPESSSCSESGLNQLPSANDTRLPTVSPPGV